MTTVESDDEAESLALALVENRLAACVQRVAIVSHYVWEGAATKSDETLLLIKTRADRVAAVTEYVGEHHSYEVPEVIEIPITSGLAGYFQWVDEAVN